MKPHLRIIFVLLFIASCFKLYPQKIESPYVVGTWQGFRSAAVSYTFDDGCANQFTKAIPLFNEFNFKLTLFTVTNWTSNWTRLQVAADSGHEVANHSKTHGRLDTMTLQEQVEEILVPNDFINSKISGHKSITMSYPYCAKGYDSLYAANFVAVRGCQGFIENPTPGSFMNVSSLICGAEGSVKKVSDFKSRAESAATKKGWLVYLIHGIDNDGGYSSLPSDTLRGSLEYLKANDAKFWVTTFSNAARYCRERNCLSVSELSSTETSITLGISDTLDNVLYNVPVSIRRPLPANWSLAVASQNGITLNSSIIEINSAKYITFDAVPDAGDVLLEMTAAIGIKTPGNDTYSKITTWQSGEKLFFRLPGCIEPSMDATLVDMRGSVVKDFGARILVNGTGDISLDGLTGHSGIYMLILSGQENRFTGKFLLN